MGSKSLPLPIDIPIDPKIVETGFTDRDHTGIFSEAGEPLYRGFLTMLFRWVNPYRNGDFRVRVD